MILRRPTVAKASDWNALDSEGRKPGERRGLDTRLVLAVNDVDLVSRNLRGYAVQ